MKLANFVIKVEQLKGICIKNLLATFENLGFIDRWACCLHEPGNGACCPHYHVYISQLKADWMKLILSNIFNVNLLGLVSSERDIILYMMRHVNIDEEKIVSNFDVKKAISN